MPYPVPRKCLIHVTWRHSEVAKEIPAGLFGEHKLQCLGSLAEIS